MTERYLVRRAPKKRRVNDEGGFAFRIAVPVGLYGHFKSSTGHPLRHITEGLGTDSLNKARKLRDRKLAEWQARFEQASRGFDLNLAEIDDQAREIYLSRLESMADAAARGLAPQTDLPPAPDGTEWTEQHRESAAWDIALGQYIKASEEGDYCPIAADLAAVQRSMNTQFAPGTAAYRLIADAIIQAHIAALKGRMQILRGEPSEMPATFLGANKRSMTRINEVNRAAPSSG
jgi:hypothetical protein